MNPKDVTRLWEELRHREPEDKLAWIRELAQNPTDESIETLLSVLEQESWFLREQAALALSLMGERVVGPLIEYLGSGLWYTRACAAGALGRIGVPAAAGALVRLLRDANRTVRDAAFDALVRLAESEIGTYAVGKAVCDLPERAQRFVLDGLAGRDVEAMGRIARATEEAVRAAGGRGLLRAVNESDELSWEDVVGGGGSQSTGP
ncbi:MAG TPA: HEAT repeat domain-containing protein [Candidatus Eisenbacteria bacterium]|jgi:HEAT repeat protein